MPGRTFLRTQACVCCLLVVCTLFYFLSPSLSGLGDAISLSNGLVVKLRPPTEILHTSRVSPARPQRTLIPAAQISHILPSTQGKDAYPIVPPRLTIIAIWNPGPQNPIYLPNFFASVAANPSIDLLFIKYDKHHVGCDTPFAPRVQNVREVCLSPSRYWDLHADFLCKHWGGCNETERNLVVAKLHERAGGDRVNSYFRPFRSAVFSKWMHPDAVTWGWCDMDMFLGNFERNLPWDLLQKFDIVFPANPVDGGEILLFTPGHLAFFKHSDHLTSEFMKFPNVKTFDNFLNLPWIGPDSEESERASLSFAFQVLFKSRYHISSIADGVFAIENTDLWNTSSSTLVPEHVSMRASLSETLDVRRQHSRGPSFTSEGREYIVQLAEGEWEHVLWFPKQYAVHFKVDVAKTLEPPYIRYAYRKDPYGPIYDRTEPFTDTVVLPPASYTHDSSPTTPIFAYEMLYNHFQIEKYSKWWHNPGLPPSSIAEDQFLFVDRERGAHVWDSAGHIAFSATL